MNAHERIANTLLAQADAAPAPGRLTILAEAQVHATLAVAAEIRESNKLAEKNSRQYRRGVAALARRRD